MSDQIKNLSRDDRIKLLQHLTSNLQNGQNTFDHKFKSVGPKGKEEIKKNLQEKLKQLKMRRTSKAVLSNLLEKQKAHNEVAVENTTVENKTIENKTSENEVTTESTHINANIKPDVQPKKKKNKKK